MGPYVAVGSHGRFIVAWTDAFPEIFELVELDRDGVPTATGSGAWVVPLERPLHVAPGSSGGWLAIWLGWGGVEAAHVDRLDGPIPDVFPVFPSGRLPRATVSPDGDIMAVWSAQESSDTDVMMRWFASDGDPLGDAIEVNTTTTGDQTEADLAAGRDSLVVVWQSDSSAGSDQQGTSIQARLFPLDGSVAGAEFQVNTETTLDQEFPRVAMSVDGNFVVTWQTEASGSPRIAARRFLPSGDPVGDEIQVSTCDGGVDMFPAVGMMDGGAFEIIWFGQCAPDPVETILRRAFRANGFPLHQPERINTCDLILAPQRPAISMNRNGDFVAAWSVLGDDGIHARIFRNTLFVDDFESGNPSAWSRIVP
jgi:hypothetical protein